MAETIMQKTQVDEKAGIHKNCFPGSARVEEKLNHILSNSEGIIREECLHLLNSGGKRLRPMLVILSGLCFSALDKSLIDMAAAAELIHMASLVHDDIIDNSNSRRGMRTINSVFGNHAAVLAGDFLFARCFEILAGINKPVCMRFMVDAIEKMSMGEINQAQDIFNTSISESRYYERVMGKTGILLSACCASGAAAAGALESEVGMLRQYGLNIGYAFQIIDDCLDFNGDESSLGKPVGMDLMSGVITLPVIILLGDRDRWDVENIIEKGSIGRDEFNYVRDCLLKSGAMDKAYDAAVDFCSKAKECLSGISPSIYKKSLFEIADKITERIS